MLSPKVLRKQVFATPESMNIMENNNGKTKIEEKDLLKNKANEYLILQSD